MDITSYLLLISFSAIATYLLALVRKTDIGYWITYGLIYGPIAIPFIFLPINNPKYNPKPTEFKELVKYNDFKSATIFSVAISQFALFLTFPIISKYIEVTSKGPGNIHPFEVMFWGIGLGIPFLIAYVISIISLIISGHALLKYKKSNIFIWHSIIVFIFIQLIYLKH